MSRSGASMLVVGALAVAAGASLAAARDAVRVPPAATGAAAPAVSAAVAGGADAAVSAAAAGAAGALAATPAGPRLRVVLDPGHGGLNLGAPSIRPGLTEKHLTLALGLALRRELEARGVEVLMTRTRDVGLSLRERVRFANQRAADVFVSLHLNATEDHAQRGYETWILTPRAVEIDSRALRAADGPARDAPAEVAALLDDLERGAALPDAARLAERIQRGLAAVRGPAGDRGVRQGSQDVLLGATMPAVLVELGFVDHPIEGEELLDPAVRAALVQALADAIVDAAPAPAAG